MIGLVFKEPNTGFRFCGIFVVLATVFGSVCVLFSYSFYALFYLHKFVFSMSNEEGLTQSASEGVDKSKVKAGRTHTRM